jgi:hypothetical protein
LENSLADVKPYDKAIAPSSFGIFVCQLSNVICKAGINKKTGNPSLGIGLPLKITEGPEAGCEMLIWFDLKRRDKNGNLFDASKFRGLLGRVMAADDLSNDKWVEIGLNQLRAFQEAGQKFEVEYTQDKGKDGKYYPRTEVRRLLMSE